MGTPGDAASQSLQTSQVKTWSYTPRTNAVDEKARTMDPPPPQFVDSVESRRYRPLALPQITPGDGQPFLRAYSNELQDRGISREAFLSIVDKINAAIIPNPEVQIFQKGASIAGWFVPGAAHLGLLASRIVVGAGNAIGHASYISRTLAKANLALFLPRGLELCIGSSQDVDEEAGQWPVHQSNMSLTRPEWRVAAYGNALAPLTTIVPAASQNGRRDPIAAAGRALGQKKSSKKLEKAQEDMAKGKFKKINKLEAELKWLILRQARQETPAHWQSVLQESEAALQFEQDAQEQRRIRAKH